jgi:hypothetical protein
MWSQGGSSEEGCGRWEMGVVGEGGEDSYAVHGLVPTRRKCPSTLSISLFEAPFFPEDFP